jgi:hypothetical protein
VRRVSAAGGLAFTLRFPRSEVELWAALYDSAQDALIEQRVAPRIRAWGYLSKVDFLVLARWKSPRSQPRCEQNPDDYIRAVTQAAFSTPNERLRIEALLLLKGVSWPTASVLLHFGHPDPYPILDYRSLWSVGVRVAPNKYDFDLWWGYTQFCRKLADRSGVTMRTLDRALWQYSKARQPSPP